MQLNLCVSTLAGILTTTFIPSPEGETTADTDGAVSEAVPEHASPRPHAAPSRSNVHRERFLLEQATTKNDLAYYSVAEPIEIGDVVALDQERPGYLRRASLAADPAVFGIAAHEAITSNGVAQVALVESRYALVKADASYGAILPGDLLVSSPTSGHVMRGVAPLPGTIIGKAAEALETGTGMIKVLVMLR